MKTVNIRENLSIVMPARNEEHNLAQHIGEIRKILPDAEIIVVDDGSTDQTGEIARNSGITVISHPYGMGNGAAIKSGARAATREYLLFMDADGQHNPADIPRLIEAMGTEFNMVVGAREPSSHASRGRRAVNYLYNRIASIMTGFEILDLTSGFRLVEARLFRQFLYLLPNGFSYPTTITMAFLRSAYPIRFVDIVARKREGKSKIRLFHDGIRFLIIILKVGAIFSPMRLFLPISAALFSSGLLYYMYTFISQGRFTNMGALLFMSSVIVFLIGIVSEQISSLHFRRTDEST